MLVGMAASLGFSGSSSMSNVNHMTSNQIMLEQLKALVAANPHYLTSGIPTNLLSQIWMADAAKVQQQPVFSHVCGIFQFIIVSLLSLVELPTMFHMFHYCRRCSP